MISYRNGKLFFDTQITPEEFVKARLAERMEEKGLLAENKNGVWNFSPWKFSGTLEENNRVYLEGNAFEGKTLSFLLKEDGEAEKVFIRSFMVTLIEEMISDKVSYSSVFSEGVFVSSDLKKVIFVPEFLFKSAYSFLSEEDKVSSGLFYVNLNLKKVPCLRFTQSAFAYEALAGALPYSAQTEEELLRLMRETDFKYIRNSVYGLTPEVSSYIDEALSLNPLDEKKLKRFLQKRFPMEDFYMECGLDYNGTLKDGKLKEVKRSSVLTREQFEQRAERDLKKKERSIKAKRFVNIHSTAIGIAAVIFAAFIFVAYSMISASAKRPSTNGLTSLETVEFYYSSVNSLNIDGIMHSAEGRKMEEREKQLSNIYVSSKMGSAYDMKVSTTDFASWLFFNREDYNIFGLSQFTVNENPASLYRTTGRRKDNVPSLTLEDGKPLSEGDTKKYDVHYFIIYSMSSVDLTVRDCRDSVTVVYKKGHWLVSDIDSIVSEALMSREEFVEDYKNAVEESGESLEDAVELLSKKYIFMPSSSELSGALKNIQERF
ncbi:MAG: hypothetical protein J5780_07210 [Treponema sp.]|nr:hypothetical protein [Treponema sp.]